MPDLIFHESEIKYRKIIDHISQTALKDGKIYVDRKALNEFVEGEDILEIIVRKKSWLLYFFLFQLLSNIKARTF